MTKPRLNQRLTLEAPRRLPDGGGGFRIVWTPIGTIWGEIDPGSGRETVAGGRQTPAVSGRIVIRSAPIGSPRRPTPECRFRQDARIFAIRAVVPLDDTGRYLACDVVEGAFA